MRRDLWFLSTACLLLIFPISAHADGVPCTDISAVNLANTTIILSGPEGDSNHFASRYDGFYNDPGGMRVVHFKNGAYLDQTDALEQWTARLESSQLLHPQRMTLRMVEIGVGNMASGGWEYVLVFGCRERKLRRLFQFSGNGVHEVHADDRGIVIEQGIWRKEDSHCCPSLETTLMYVWSARDGSYILKSATKPIPTER